MSLHSRRPPQQCARLPLTQPKAHTQGQDRRAIRPGDHVMVQRRARPRKVLAVHGIIDSPDGELRWEVEFTDGQRFTASVIERHATPEEIRHFERMA